MSRGLGAVQKQIVEAAARGVSKPVEFAALTGCSPSVIRDALAGLVKRDIVQRVGMGTYSMRSQISTHALITNGNCLAILPGLSGVDHVITDPPYDDLVHKRPRAGNRTLVMGNGKMGGPREKEFGFDSIKQEEIESVAKQFVRLAKRWTLIFSNIELAPRWRVAMEAAGARYVRAMMWEKLACAPSFHGRGPASAHEAISVFHSPNTAQRWNARGKRGSYRHKIAVNSPKEKRVHPTQKPIDLMMELIRDFTDPGDLILDPFCGSGTTGAASLKLGRRFIGIERSEKFASIAKNRLSESL